MAVVRYIAHDGNEHELNVVPGSTVQQAAVDNGIDGIAAECGGGCSCATCHVYVDEAWIDKLPPPDSMEESMIGFVAAESRDNSRLSCQLTVTEGLDGLIVRMPDVQ